MNNPTSSVRIPLVLPPRAKRRAFLLHSIFAASAMLVTGTAITLFCFWIQPVDFGSVGLTLYRSIYDDIPAFTLGAVPVILNWQFVAINLNRLTVIMIASCIIIIAAAAFGFIRRHRATPKRRDVLWPCAIVIANALILTMYAHIKMAEVGRTPLVNAVYYGFDSRVYLLMALGADPNTRTMDATQGALGGAVMMHRPEIALAMIEKHPPPPALATEILPQAAYRGFATIVEALLQCGAVVNSTGLARKESPLATAAAADAVLCASILISHGADLNHGDIHGQTALHAAAANGSVDTARLLLQSGATLKPDNHGKTPLHVVCLYAKFATGVKYVEDYDITLLRTREHFKDVIRLLLDHGADINAICSDGKTPYNYASDREIRQFIGVHGGLSGNELAEASALAESRSRNLHPSANH